MVGVGFIERPDNVEFSVQTWADQALGVTDSLGIEKAHLVGNSFATKPSSCVVAKTK